MPWLDAATLRRARTNPVQVNLADLIGIAEAVSVRLGGAWPDGFLDDLACEGLTIFRDADQWCVGPLSD